MTLTLIKSGTKDNEELNSIINDSRFEKKVLVCTKAMDNGINIDDPKLKHIVIMAWDQITFVQMLGRKRIDINNPVEVNLYIMTRYKKSFIHKLDILENKQAEINLYSLSIDDFNRKYDNDLKNFSSINDLFYKEKDKGYRINMVGFTRLNKDMEFARKMIEAFEDDKEYAYIHEQLNWLGLDDPLPSQNLIGDVIVDDDAKSLEEYLGTLVGKRLFKNEQQELKGFVTEDFDSMISKLQGRHTPSKRNPGLKILNNLILACDIPYVIKSHNKSERVGVEVKKVSYWSVELLHNDEV